MIRRQVVKAAYEDAIGVIGNRLDYRNQESSMKVVETERPWSFDDDGALQSAGVYGCSRIFTLLHWVFQIRGAVVINPCGALVLSV